MLGKRSKQLGFLEADHLYLDYVGRGSFYGFLASLRGQLFRDEDFAELYCPDNGRDSVPPSLVATALLLQAYDKVSDLEAKQRADFDIRWKVALGIEVEDRPFAKSTLQLFRAQLILHDQVRSVFQRSLQFARQTGCLKGRRMKVAVDTTYILGRGAVKDTYNLLADGIVQVVRALAQLDGARAEEWALRHGLELYFGSSVKGEAGIDWDNKKERQALLQKIVADADLVLELARQAQGRFPADSPERQAIGEAAELLGQLLLQDVERQEDGPARKDGVSRDRVPSAHDPEMRHGRKSSSKGKGRTVTLHPQEALLQQARAFQQSEDFAEYPSRRQVVEHRLARLVQLGVRQSRYFGRAKTLYQLLLAATVANLTLVATKTGMMSQGPGSSPNKPENRPDRPAAGACPEFATGSPIVTAQFILVAASWAALSLRPGPVHWLTSASSRHSRAFQPGF